MPWARKVCGCPGHGILSADDDSEATGVHLLMTKNRNISKEILDILKIPKGRKYVCIACAKYARSVIKVIKVMYYVCPMTAVLQ